MPISGIVVRCLGSCADSVANQMAAFEGVEVHGVLPDGQIIAVVEADTVDGEVTLVTELQSIEDVISVQLAYHNFEDFEAERP
ncbi:MAG: chaperone NapD [Geobacteraceae bacterium]|nr:chaperone NapD [Geobacteraceae bacterium]NTW78583.1 chaperone NapD [Geobacteraceae bacterium]